MASRSMARRSHNIHGFNDHVVSATASYDPGTFTKQDYYRSGAPERAHSFHMNGEGVAVTKKLVKRKAKAKKHHHDDHDHGGHGHNRSLSARGGY